MAAAITDDGALIKHDIIKHDITAKIEEIETLISEFKKYTIHFPHFLIWLSKKTIYFQWWFDRKQMDRIFKNWKYRTKEEKYVKHKGKARMGEYWALWLDMYKLQKSDANLIMQQYLSILERTRPIQPAAPPPKTPPAADSDDLDPAWFFFSELQEQAEKDDIEIQMRKLHETLEEFRDDEAECRKQAHRGCRDYDDDDAFIWRAPAGELKDQLELFLHCLVNAGTNAELRDRVRRINLKYKYVRCIVFSILKQIEENNKRDLNDEFLHKMKDLLDKIQTIFQESIDQSRI